MKRRPRAPSPHRIADDAACAELWLASLAPRTREAYAQDLAKYREAVRSPMREVGITELIAFQAGLQGAAASRARTMHAMRSLFAFARKAGYLAFDPMRALRTPRVRPHLDLRYLSPEDVGRLVSQAEPPRDRLIVQTLYYAGLRVSELCGLTWRDLRQRRDLGSVQLSVLGKGGLPRQVPVPAFLGEALLALRGKASADDPVFVSRQHGPIVRSQVFRIVKECAVKAGLPGEVSPHWLRHAHATHAIERGVPLHVVQHTLGHSSLSVTGLYLHARPGDASGLHLGV